MHVLPANNMLPIIRSLIIWAIALPACSVGESENDQLPILDFSKYPVMRCQVVFAQGNFFGYMPPQQDDPFYLNLSQLPGLKKLVFDPKKGNYIPLFDSLHIEKATLISETGVIDLRLVSQHGKNRRMILDIEQYDSSKPVNSKAWIIQEDKIVRSAALMECRFEAELE